MPGTAVAIVTDVSDKAAVDRLFVGRSIASARSTGWSTTREDRTERHFLEGDEEWWEAFQREFKGRFSASARGQDDGQRETGSH